MVRNLSQLVSHYDTPYEQNFSIKVSGELKPTPDLRVNRRFEQPADK
jgi:hypothetical protein